MPNEKPVEQRCTRAANVQVAGRRWSESDTDLGTHESRLRKFTQIHSMKILPARRRTCRSGGRLTLVTDASGPCSERTASITSHQTFARFTPRNHIKIPRRYRATGKSRNLANGCTASVASG